MAKKVRNMPKRDLPAVRVDRAVREKVTRRRAGIRWDSVVEKAHNDVGGNQEAMTSVEEFGRYIHK